MPLAHPTLLAAQPGRRVAARGFKWGVGSCRLDPDCRYSSNRPGTAPPVSKVGLRARVVRAGLGSAGVRRF